MSQREPTAGTFTGNYGWVLLLAALLIIFNCMYVLNGVPHSEGAEFIATFLLPFALALWVVWDARSRRCTPCYDFGLLVYFFWIAAIPGYLVWTRGWRGLIVFIGFIILVLSTWIAPYIVWSLTQRNG